LENDKPLERLRRQMESDWDRRAEENAFHFVATGHTETKPEQFFESGRTNVREHILTDMLNICQDRLPAEMRVLEIGCGVGRITRALASVFGEVYAADVSEKMIRKARHYLRDVPNVRFYKNNGTDLAGIEGENLFDFAFSMLVFQHVPSEQVIENYVKEVARLLKPGHLFKFQVQGAPGIETSPDNTWVGASLSRENAAAIAARCGMEARYMHGDQTQDFWLWFFKYKAPAG
jgi:2-polyprenyl-3-methyl-5-hydroxy-6-metoxy-1,4-benzoquinol methylase